MPLLFDLPQAELPAYQGVNPRPHDYDDYWDAALAELAAVDADVELVPADFQAPYAECFHMYFTGTKGARVHAKLLRPRSASTPHPAVLMFHGYSGNAGDWQSKLGYAAAGFTVAALDCRGQGGGRSEDVGGVPGWTLRGHIVRGLDGEPEDLLYRQVFLDTARMAQIVMEMEDVDADRVGATGGSQGGALTLACAALEPRVKRPRPSIPSCATTNGCGTSTWTRMPMPSCANGSATLTRAMSVKKRSSRVWVISTCSSSPRASAPR